jgi:hypothetical protein
MTLAGTARVAHGLLTPALESDGSRKQPSTTPMPVTCGRMRRRSTVRTGRQAHLLPRRRPPGWLPGVRADLTWRAPAEARSRGERVEVDGMWRSALTDQ